MIIRCRNSGTSYPILATQQTAAPSQPTPPQPLPPAFTNGLSKGFNWFSSTFSAGLVIDINSRSTNRTTALHNQQYFLPDVVQSLSEQAPTCSWSRSSLTVFDGYSAFASAQSAIVGSAVGAVSSTRAAGSASYVRQSARQQSSSHDITIFSTQQQCSIASVSLESRLLWTFTPVCRHFFVKNIQLAFL